MDKLDPWLSRGIRNSFRGLGFRPQLFKGGVVVICTLVVLGIFTTTWHMTAGFGYVVETGVDFLHLHRVPLPEFEGLPLDRTNDRKDIFADWRGREECGFGAMDLHVPLTRTCRTRQSLLDAMTDGERPDGFDKPFKPLGCDLHFFSTAEVCEILSRFENVIFIGDSLIRHTEWSVAMLMQENYYDGGQNDWLSIKEEDCKCDFQSLSMWCINSETNVSTTNFLPTSMGCHTQALCRIGLSSSRAEYKKTD